MQLSGLHHITAITGNASLNVAFYTEVLGLRLVKKTVNQDDVSAYHLFYGDEKGKPGFDLTFFDWPHAGLNQAGAGTISAISFGVNGRQALEWWVQRLDTFKVLHDGIQIREATGRAILAFRDPEGQRLELIDAEGRLQSTPWKGSPIPPEVNTAEISKMSKRRVPQSHGVVGGGQEASWQRRSKMERAPLFENQLSVSLVDGCITCGRSVFPKRAVKNSFSYGNGGYPKPSCQESKAGQC